MRLSYFLFSHGSVFVRLIGNLAVLVILARWLSLESYSSYIAAFTVATFVVLFVDCGVNNYLLCEGGKFSAAQRNDFLASIFVLRAFLYLCISVVLYVCFGEEGAVASLYLFSGALLETYYTGLKVDQRYRKEFLDVAIGYLMVLLAAVIISFSVNLLFVLVIPRIALLSHVFGVYRESKSMLRIDIAISNVFKLRNYGLDGFFSGISGNIDSYLVALLFGKEALAIYQQASRFYLAFMSMAMGVAGVALPLAQRLEDTGKKLFVIFSMFSLCGLALSIVYCICVPFLAPHLFGFEEILDSRVYYLLGGVILLRYVAAGFGAWLSMRGDQGLRVVINFIMLVFVVVFASIFSKDIVGLLVVVFWGQVGLLISYFIAVIFREKKIFGFESF